jgi:hypothetical protein
MNKYNRIVAQLQRSGVLFEPGLSAMEIEKAEHIYNVHFPSALKSMLSVAIPISPGFYNWRTQNTSDCEIIKKAIEFPLQGLIFELNTNAFWCEVLGDKPTDNVKAQRKLTDYYNRVPQMIPVYSHRYIPCFSACDNPPVFSIMQSDIICYGSDLIEYLEIEFGYKKYSDIDFSKVPHIEFWSDLL